jgi:Zn-dependent M16 (insulinase) family peptidase
MLYARNLQSSLLPHHTYGYNSGGEPINIPDLTVSNTDEESVLAYTPIKARIKGGVERVIWRH